MLLRAAMAKSQIGASVSSLPESTDIYFNSDLTSHQRLYPAGSEVTLSLNLFSISGEFRRPQHLNMRATCVDGNIR
jgi:hypothetical protein